ncbi:MAG: hypothetical protein JYX80_04705 [Candidatus Scalindua sediminis]|nr:hypothetical protein [Candidatus Scalindua sediminis]
MGYDTLTDFNDEIIHQSRAFGLTKHTESQGSRSVNYDSYYNKTGVDVKPVIQRRSRAVSYKRQVQQIAISEEVNRLLRKASETVDQLVVTKDLIEQANYAFAFKDCLEDLWKNRKNREDNWGDLLNIVQVVLAQVEFEQLSEVQKLSIKKVTNVYLCKPEILDPDIDDALEALSEAGFDPWSGISGKPEV